MLKPIEYIVEQSAQSSCIDLVNTTIKELYEAYT